MKSGVGERCRRGRGDGCVGRRFTVGVVLGGRYLQGRSGHSAACCGDASQLGASERPASFSQYGVLPDDRRNGRPVRAATPHSVREPGSAGAVRGFDSRRSTRSASRRGHRRLCGTVRSAWSMNVANDALSWRGLDDGLHHGEGSQPARLGHEENRTMSTVTPDPSVVGSSQPGLAIRARLVDVAAAG